MRGRDFRPGRLVSHAATGLLVVALLIWWLLPIYNMMLIALDPEGKTEFTGDIWPSAPTLEAFRGVLFQEYWYFQDFWHQLGNSFFIGIMTMALTALISSLACFALGLMRLGRGGAISTSALLSYMGPAYLLVIGEGKKSNIGSKVDSIRFRDSQEIGKMINGLVRSLERGKH